MTIMINRLHTVLALQREAELKERSQSTRPRPATGTSRESQRVRVLASLIAFPRADEKIARRSA